MITGAGVMVGRVFTDPTGNEAPQHRWELVDASVGPDDPSRLLVEFVGSEAFWGREAGKWEEAAALERLVRPEAMMWTRDGTAYTAVEGFDL